MGWIRGNKQKVSGKVLTLKMVLVFARDLQQVMIEKKILKQILRYITNYTNIHHMPCYFVSRGVEIPMTSQTFDFIWNSFGNKELIDSETSSSS